MVVPNYTYLKLKMPGPSGVITVGTSHEHAYECDVACTEYAEALVESETLVADLERLAKSAWAHFYQKLNTESNRTKTEPNCRFFGFLVRFRFSFL
jgi:hypothetical protein